jgi:hypothetical protein
MSLTLSWGALSRGTLKATSSPSSRINRRRTVTAYAETSLMLNWGRRLPPAASCRCGLPRRGGAKRRCILPVHGFFEWKAIKGQKAKQPYAIAMKDGPPFGIAGIWENWKEPASGEWIRTFAIITTDANELVAGIHDRMPVILPRVAYARWLGEEARAS